MVGGVNTYHSDPIITAYHGPPVAHPIGLHLNSSGSYCWLHTAESSVEYIQGIKPGHTKNLKESK